MEMKPTKQPREGTVHPHSSQSYREMKQLSEKRQQSHKKLSEIHSDLEELEERLQMFGNRFKEVSQRLVGKQETAAAPDDTSSQKNEVQFELKRERSKQEERPPPIEMRNKTSKTYRVGRRKKMQERQQKDDQLDRIYQLNHIPLAYFQDISILQNHRLFKPKLRLDLVGQKTKEISLTKHSKLESSQEKSDEPKPKKPRRTSHKGSMAFRQDAQIQMTQPTFRYQGPQHCQKRKNQWMLAEDNLHYKRCTCCLKGSGEDSNSEEKTKNKPIFKKLIKRTVLKKESADQRKETDDKENSIPRNQTVHRHPKKTLARRKQLRNPQAQNTIPPEQSQPKRQIRQINNVPEVSIDAISNRVPSIAEMTQQFRNSRRRGTKEAKMSQTCDNFHKTSSQRVADRQPLDLDSLSSLKDNGKATVDRCQQTSIKQLSKRNIGDLPRPKNQTRMTDASIQNDNRAPPTFKKMLHRVDQTMTQSYDDAQGIEIVYKIDMCREKPVEQSIKEIRYNKIFTKLVKDADLPNEQPIFQQMYGYSKLDQPCQLTPIKYQKDEYSMEDGLSDEEFEISDSGNAHKSRNMDQQLEKHMTKCQPLVIEVTDAISQIRVERQKLTLVVRELSSWTRLAVMATDVIVQEEQDVMEHILISPQIVTTIKMIQETPMEISPVGSVADPPVNPPVEPSVEPSVNPLVQTTEISHEVTPQIEPSKTETPPNDIPAIGVVSPDEQGVPPSPPPPLSKLDKSNLTVTTVCNDTHLYTASAPLILQKILSKPLNFIDEQQSLQFHQSSHSTPIKCNIVQIDVIEPENMLEQPIQEMEEALSLCNSPAEAASQLETQHFKTTSSYEPSNKVVDSQQDPPMPPNRVSQRNEDTVSEHNNTPAHRFDNILAELQDSRHQEQQDVDNSMDGCSSQHNHHEYECIAGHEQIQDTSEAQQHCQEGIQHEQTARLQPEVEDEPTECVGQGKAQPYEQIILKDQPECSKKQLIKQKTPEQTKENKKQLNQLQQPNQQSPQQSVMRTTSLLQQISQQPQQQSQQYQKQQQYQPQSQGQQPQPQCPPTEPTPLQPPQLTSIQSPQQTVESHKTIRQGPQQQTKRENKQHSQQSTKPTKRQVNTSEKQATLIECGHNKTDQTGYPIVESPKVDKQSSTEAAHNNSQNHKSLRKTPQNIQQQSMKTPTTNKSSHTQTMDTYTDEYVATDVANLVATSIQTHSQTNQFWVQTLFPTTCNNVEVQTDALQIIRQQRQQTPLSTRTPEQQKQQKQPYYETQLHAQPNASPQRCVARHTSSDAFTTTSPMLLKQQSFNIFKSQQPEQLPRLDNSTNTDRQYDNQQVLDRISQLENRIMNRNEEQHTILRNNTSQQTIDQAAICKHTQTDYSIDQLNRKCNIKSDAIKQGGEESSGQPRESMIPKILKITEPIKQPTNRIQQVINKNEENTSANGQQQWKVTKELREQSTERLPGTKPSEQQPMSAPTTFYSLTPTSALTHPPYYPIPFLDFSISYPHHPDPLIHMNKPIIRNSFGATPSQQSCPMQHTSQPISELPANSVIYQPKKKPYLSYGSILNIEIRRETERTTRQVAQQVIRMMPNHQQKEQDQEKNPKKEVIESAIEGQTIKEKKLEIRKEIQKRKSPQNRLMTYETMNVARIRSKLSEISEEDGTLYQTELLKAFQEYRTARQHFSPDVETALRLVDEHLGAEFRLRLFQDAQKTHTYSRVVFWMFQKGVFQANVEDVHTSDVQHYSIGKWLSTKKLNIAEMLCSITGAPCCSIVFANKSASRIWKILSSCRINDNGARMFALKLSKRQSVMVKSVRQVTDVNNATVRLVSFQEKGRQSYMQFEQFIQQYEQAVISYANLDFHFNKAGIPDKTNDLDESFTVQMTVGKPTRCFVSFWRQNSVPDKVRMLLYEEETKNHYKYRGKSESNEQFFFESNLSRGNYLIIIEGLTKMHQPTISTYSSQPVQLKIGKWMLRTSSSLQNQLQSYIRVRRESGGTSIRKDSICLPPSS